MKSENKASLSRFLKFVVNKHQQMLDGKARADIMQLIAQL